MEQDSFYIVLMILLQHQIIRNENMTQHIPNRNFMYDK